MKKPALLFALATLSLSSLRGEWTVTFPLPPTPPGGNSAAIPSPRDDWFSEIEDARKVAALVKDPQIVFDGDSITNRWRSTGQAAWKEHFANRQAVDFGIGGDRTECILWRLQNHQMDGLHPKLIVLLIGTNNLSRNTDAEIIAGIEADVNAYRKLCPDAVVLVQGIFPRFAEPTHPYRQRIKNINQAVAAFADGQKVVFFDFGDKLLQPDGSISPDMMPDFLHPLEKGYEIWANAIQPLVDKYAPATGK